MIAERIPGIVYEAHEGFDPMNHGTPALDLAVLRKLVGHLGKGCLVVEVGSWAGLTAMAMADAGAKVACVDYWSGNPCDRLGTAEDPLAAYMTFLANVKDRLLTSIFPCFGSSSMWAQHWPYPVDMVFIDADHRYENVAQDIMAWRGHIRPGGILCGHDYGVPGADGVTRAVDEFVEGVTVEGSVWYARVE